MQDDVGEMADLLRAICIEAFGAIGAMVTRVHVEKNEGSFESPPFAEVKRVPSSWPSRHTHTQDWVLEE